MKKGFLYFVMLILSTLIITACGSSEESSGEQSDDSTGGSKEETVYTVATDSNFVPFEFQNPDTGEMEGFDIELIQALADESGVEIEFETLEFSGLIAGMETGRFEIGIAGITITDERKEKIDFSDPYYDAGLITVVEADNKEITSMDDLSGKKVATRTGSTSYDYLTEKYPDAEVVPFEGIVEAYMELRSGRIDAVVYDSPNALYYVNEKAEGSLKVVGDIAEAQQYGIAFKQGSELVSPFNEALEKFKEDGTYDDIYEKWFGERPFGTEK
jgi:glutamine transport system substrate-binding protein